VRRSEKERRREGENLKKKKERKERRREGVRRSEKERRREGEKFINKIQDRLRIGEERVVETPKVKEIHAQETRRHRVAYQNTVRRTLAIMSSHHHHTQLAHQGPKRK